jgi:hypothetical protein
MQDLFETGRIADLALAVLVIEALVILFHNRLTGRGPTLGRTLPFLLAGVCLLLAWRTSAAGLAWPLPAALLAGAGAAHLVDLLRRRL